MRALVVIGTRPEAIKLWPVVGELRAAGVETFLCDTGQHPDLLAQVFPVLGLEPDVRLGRRNADSSPDELAGALTPRIAATIETLKPDWVVVQGDTTSALAAARAASMAGIRLAHVEAGLRTFDPLAPWPEEMNRCEIARLADLHFAPTPRAARNLLAEGISESTILVTGNTAIGALQDMIAKLDASPAMREAVDIELGAMPHGKRLILVTVHRRENIRAGLAEFVRGLVALAARDDVEIVLPLHPNPALRPLVSALTNVPGISVRAPLSYPACLTLLQRASLLITDSGGLQEEAPSLGLPMLVTRVSTERPEALECGAGRLVKMADVVPAAAELLDDPLGYDAMAKVRYPFGDGQAAARIVRSLQNATSDMSEANHVSPSFS